MLGCHRPKDRPQAAGFRLWHGGGVALRLRFPSRSTVPAHRPQTEAQRTEPGGVDTSFGLANLCERHVRLPFQKLSRAGDVGFALFGVIPRQRLENYLAARPNGVDYFTRELQYGN